MADFEQLLNRQLNERYYTSRELRYGKEPGTFLSGHDASSFIDFKHDEAEKGNPKLIGLELKSWNSAPLFYASADQLMNLKNELFSFLLDDWAQNNGNFLSFRDSDEITKSRIYSEIEGSLSIEAVPTTRKRLAALLGGTKEPENKNDVIIANMGRAIYFVSKRPAFTPENLFTLYGLLTDGCLEEENKLAEGDFYRNGEVEIDDYHGCPVEKIKECMDSLFAFVNKYLHSPSHDYMLPHICHYYLLYVHPYFDYNGRTARMVSLWISILSGGVVFPSVISEAIDQKKNHYYSALRETRNSGNDLTYFLIFIYDAAIDYAMAYANLDHIEKALVSRKVHWSEAERTYFKKLLISSDRPFSFREFQKMVKVEMTRQGALKILNQLESYGLLTSEVRDKTKYFEVNREALFYLPKNLRQLVA